MKVHAGRRYRLYPTEGQAERLTSWGHTCRWLYNTALEQRQFAWRQRKTTLGVTAQCAYLTEAREELDWVADLPAQSGQQVLRQLDQAYRNWWNPQHPAGAPTHRRRSARLSVPFPGQAIQVWRLNRRWGAVSLPKVGVVKFRWSRPLGGAVRNAVVSFDGVAWYVGFGVHIDVTTPEMHARPDTVVGVDRGVKVALAMSDGRMWNRTFTSPGQERDLARLKSKAGRQDTTRRKRGAKTSNRARKVRAEIARAEAKTRNRRRDFVMWAANRLCAQHAAISIEGLNIKAMTATAKGTVEEPGTNVRQKAGLNRAILDKGWGLFQVALANRARITGTRIVKVPAAFTSQQCSRCGNTNRNNRESQAVFRCGSCGYQANADVNAAINVRDAAEAAPQLTGRAARDRGRPAPCRPPAQRRRQPALEAGISRH
ncbi:transposase [Micromonospora sp. DR5-3]|uniref:RNA-guided endonuclease InsQ/TnpB family protein n=1 Tax=unclassified Micromonospora TaxID=2617518 RepID=UPI00165224AF|nr:MULTISPECIES: RNA-guided endonuclease TnpB family protein [unclassified Micromonospora]MCW3815921.1 transposase [Micromonospora sp. DR5-3]